MLRASSFISPKVSSMVSLCDVTLLLFINVVSWHGFVARGCDVLHSKDQNEITGLNTNRVEMETCDADHSDNIHPSSKEISHLDTDQIGSFNRKLAKMIETLSVDIPLGEKRDLNFSSMSITLEKISSTNLSSKRLTQSTGTDIRFPSSNIQQLNQSVIINLITFPFSSAIALSLHQLDGTEIPVENTTDPFDIRIPRQRNTLMPAMIRQNVTSSKIGSPFMYHSINLTHGVHRSVSLHVELQPDDANLSYLFILRFQGVPDWTTQRFDAWKLLCPQDRKNGDSKYTFFLDNMIIADHQWAILGIHEVTGCHRDLIEENRRFSSDYSLGVFLSGCYYLDDEQKWRSDGLRVGSETSAHVTQCLSTHLTTFAAGFSVLPNPVDFNALNPDFLSNITIYTTLMIIIVLYLATMGYSYYKDRIDARLLLVIPLQDNNASDNYLYQFVVFTGMRANAGTKSKVHFILSGNNDETSVRTLNGGSRPILDRGHSDSFIMSVPRSLGQLNYLRVWHDNSGPGSDASWFLKYIIVRDLQTMETNYFICQQWLAVEKETGEIDRTLLVASEDETNELKHVLSKNAYRSMADNHLWFSIFAFHVPSAKRFTRVQRCTCCFVLLFISLLMNIMYYNTKKDLESSELDESSLSIGPFYFSKEQILIGVIVEMTIFLPSLFLVTLFRRSKPRHPRTISLVAEAVQKIRKTASHDPRVANMPLESKRKFLLPWWCLILAYILSFLFVGVSIFFIAVRGIQYGDVRVRQWLSSIVTGFFASIVLTQPLKVLSLAVLFMCFCRKRSHAEAFLDEEDPIADFTVSAEDARRKFPANSVLARTRLDPYRSKRERSRLQQLRELRMKEIHSWFILRELFLLLLFLGALYAISFANRNVNEAHRIVNYLRHQFLEHDHLYSYDYGSGATNKMYVFNNIKSIDGYWHWLENTFVPRIQEVVWSDADGNRNKSMSHHRANRMISQPRLRQLRVKNESCPRKVLSGQIDIDDCQLPYTWYNEDKSPFGPVTDYSDRGSFPFKYKTSEELDGYIYSSSYATYMGGGYVHDMVSTDERILRRQFQLLQEHRWIDRHTRAVFLSFGLYNANSNLFVYCSLLLEQLPSTGELVLRASFQPFKLLQLYSGTDLIYCLIYLILIIYYMHTEIRLFLEKRKTYIREFWSYVNWVIIICSWMGVGVQFYREAERKRMGTALRAKKRSNPVNLQFFSYLDSFLIYLLGFCCFFGTIKILRLLRFNRRLSLLHLFLKKSARQLLGFLLMSSFVFVAFTSLFFLIFHPHLEHYSTWLFTAQTCFEMIAVHFTAVNDMFLVNPLAAGFCLFLFIFLAVFLLTNMFVSIIVDNFNEVRRDQMKRGNEVELLQFVVNKMKQLLGRSSGKKSAVRFVQPTAELPTKVDALMFAIDKAYKPKPN